VSAIRAGLITVMSEDATWPQHFVDKFRKNHTDAEAALVGLGFDVVTLSQDLGRTFRQMVTRARDLRAHDIDVLILYVPDWSYSSNAVAAGLNIDVPVIVWSDANPDQNGIVGAAIIRGGLDEVGVKTKLLHGRVDDPATLRKLEVWCRGIAAATRLRNKKIGVGGSRCMGMYTAHVDPSEIRRRFGVELDGWEQVDLFRRAELIAEDEVQAMLGWMREEFGRLEAKQEVLLAQIRMYLALRELIREREYDAVCVKCLPELPACHTTFCLAISILNDRSDHRGPKDSIVCGCESDVNGALTMQLMKTLNGGPVMFTDVLKIYRERNEIGLANCGSSATDFAASKKDVYWVTEGLKEFDWKMGGTCPQYMTRAGRITMARLGRVAGEYVLLITGGTTIEYPREKLEEINFHHPQAYLKLDCPIDTFIDNLRCNHVHFVFGNFYEELEIACWALDLRPILLPRSSPPATAELERD
jgi:L-fucose isomerase